MYFNHRHLMTAHWPMLSALFTALVMLPATAKKVKLLQIKNGAAYGAIWAVYFYLDVYDFRLHYKPNLVEKALSFYHVVKIINVKKKWPSLTDTWSNSPFPTSRLLCQQCDQTLTLFFFKIRPFRTMAMFSLV